MVSSGFTETSFMSSTRDLRVALDYSGVKHGRVATMLPPFPSPLSPFAAFSYRSSTKACHCPSETFMKRVGFTVSLAPSLSQVLSLRQVPRVCVCVHSVGS
jgi:hypothetical protein